VIYLDNAATTFPKPPAVIEAVRRTLQQEGGNPGRSGHRLSMQAAERVWQTRKKLAAFFGCASEEQVIFTSGCTAALNMAVFGLLRGGGHCLVSSMEHNAVVRPLQALRRRGVRWEAFAVDPFDRQKTLAAFAARLRRDTAAVICTHASNVCGTVLPVEAMAHHCAERGIPFVLDAAQTAGVLPIDMQDTPYSCVCLPGHKGLYGPMGVGVLLLGEGVQLPPLIYGGTGTQSLAAEQPQDLPEALESGTVNLPGIAGLEAGVDFVRRRTREKLCSHQLQLAQKLHRGLAAMEGVSLFAPEPMPGLAVGTVACRFEGVECEEAVRQLDARSIAVRGGWQCAALAHETLKTTGTGVVRLSFGAFNTARQVDTVLQAAAKIVRGVQESAPLGRT